MGTCYYQQGNYAEAVKWFGQLAEQGNTSAQYNLGICYGEGNGVAQDYVEAVNWFRKSAERGNAAAQYRLGNCYYAGKGVEQDYELAKEWYLNAVHGFYDQNDKNMESGLLDPVTGPQVVDAIYELGKCYYFGNGVNQDYSLALELYAVAASHGHIEACIDLAQSYLEGKSVDQDYSKAEDYFFKQRNLGQQTH